MPGGTEVALVIDLPCIRVDDEALDAGALRAAVGIDRRVEGAPQLAVRLHHLLHAGVVGVRPRDDFVVCRLRADEQPPAAGAGDGHGRRVVDAEALRRVRAGRGAGAGLLLPRRDAYWPTGRTWFDRLSAGDAEFSDDVLVSVHATSCCDVRVPPVPATGCCASSAAFELRKYSVPPLLVLNEPVPGDCAGQTVKPGCVEPASLAR